MFLYSIKFSVDEFFKDPKYFTTAPSLAVPLAMERAGLSMSDIGPDDYFELNEAFSVVGVANMKLLGISPERTNVFGGGVSMGHPLGISFSHCAFSFFFSLSLSLSSFLSFFFLSLSVSLSFFFSLFFYSSLCLFLSLSSFLSFFFLSLCISLSLFSAFCPFSLSSFLSVSVSSLLPAHNFFQSV